MSLVWSDQTPRGSDSSDAATYYRGKLEELCGVIDNAMVPELLLSIFRRQWRVYVGPTKREMSDPNGPGGAAEKFYTEWAKGISSGKVLVSTRLPEEYGKTVNSKLLSDRT